MLLQTWYSGDKCSDTRMISWEIKTSKCGDNWTERAQESPRRAEPSRDDPRLTDARALHRPRGAGVSAGRPQRSMKMRTHFKSFVWILKVLNTSSIVYWERSTLECFIYAWQNLSLKALGFPHGICWECVKCRVPKPRIFFFNSVNALLKGFCCAHHWETGGGSRGSPHLNAKVTHWVTHYKPTGNNQTHTTPSLSSIPCWPI